MGYSFLSSNTIPKNYSLFSEALNDLVICRVDRTSGKPKGGDEVFLLCEKINRGMFLTIIFLSDSPLYMIKIAVTVNQIVMPNTACLILASKVLPFLLIIFCIMFGMMLQFVFVDDVRVRFYEEVDGQVRWEAFGDFGQNDVHRQVSFTFNLCQKMFLLQLDISKAGSTGILVQYMYVYMTV